MNERSPGAGRSITGFSVHRNFLVTSLVIIVCVLCIYTVCNNSQQQQNYQKKLDQFLQAATLGVTEFQVAKSEFQAATLRLQELNSEEAHYLSTLDDIQRHRLERNSANVERVVSDVRRSRRRRRWKRQPLPVYPARSKSVVTDILSVREKRSRRLPIQRPRASPIRRRLQARAR